ncbi:hypothetical protein [Antarctobacter jejuensis]|uniref:hypothetical protein n=1 Tax=Antarctobacter jejuensis TaxID=1439938 RepID=UPI003FD61221
MATSFEDRIAKIHAKNGSVPAGMPSMDTPGSTGPGSDLSRDTLGRTKASGPGRLIAMFGLTFAVGLLLIGGAAFLAP